VPRSFSADVAELAGAAGAAPQATLDGLTNEGSGIFQPTVFDQVRDQALDATRPGML
jgi:hypothetical protein